jgi:DNA-binding MarR family transcriptional regulator
MSIGLNTTLLAQEMANTLVQLNRTTWQHDSFNGLKGSEFIFMASLAALKGSSGDGIKASELGKALNVTGAAVTHILNALEKAGYVERVSDPTDRRIVLVKLTETGRHTLQEANGIFLAYLQELIEFLGEKDSTELIRLLSLTTGFFKDR